AVSPVVRSRNAHILHTTLSWSRRSVTYAGRGWTAHASMARRADPAADGPVAASPAGDARPRTLRVGRRDRTARSVACGPRRVSWARSASEADAGHRITRRTTVAATRPGPTCP